jgi:hypothetical protein
VQRREGEHAVAGQMDLPPQAAREVLLGERGQLDREHHVEGHDPERDRERLPGRGQGHEEVHGPERREVVGHQRAHVHEHEPDGERAEEAVHAEQPPRADPPLQDPGRVEHAPEHRGQEQPPRHDPGGSGDVPGQVFGHRASSGFLGARRDSECRIRSAGFGAADLGGGLGGADLGGRTWGGGLGGDGLGGDGLGGVDSGGGGLRGGGAGDQAANAVTVPTGWTAPVSSVHQPVTP